MLLILTQVEPTCPESSLFPLYRIFYQCTNVLISSKLKKTLFTLCPLLAWSSSFSSFTTNGLQALFVLPGHNLSSSFVLEALQDFTPPPPTQLMGLFKVTSDSDLPVFTLLTLSAMVMSLPTDVFPCFPAQTPHLHSLPARWLALLSSACFSSSQLWALYHSRTTSWTYLLHLLSFPQNFFFIFWH